jgi:hypothetical protein
MSPLGQLLFALVAMLLGAVPLSESLAASRWLRRIAREPPPRRAALVHQALQDLRLARGEPGQPAPDHEGRAVAAIRFSVWRRATWGVVLVALGLLLALDSLR